jgi:hypothetical protein
MRHCTTQNATGGADLDLKSVNCSRLDSRTANSAIDVAGPFIKLRVDRPEFPLLAALRIAHDEAVITAIIANRGIRSKHLAAFRMLSGFHRKTISLPVDLDVFFAAAMGDGNHDADADQNRDSDQCPGGADPLQHTQLPESGHDSANQDDETNEIHACPFH